LVLIINCQKLTKVQLHLDVKISRQSSKINDYISIVRQPK